MAYTAEQTSTIEYLVNRGKAVHKRMDSVTDAAESEKLSAELNDIKLELNKALNAEAMFRAHLKVAEDHLKEAEAIYRTYHGARS